MPAEAADLDRAQVDARAVALFDNGRLQSQIRELDRVELASVWRVTSAALTRLEAREPEPIGAYAVHQRLLDGLAGEALLMSSSLFLNNLAEAERFFGLSFKTIKSRLGGSLDTAASELAMRAARVVITAAGVLGSHDAARAYMHTRNFALGGATPAELIRTAEGERIVLDELHAQAEGGPI